jgi:hypothetical protein
MRCRHHRLRAEVLWFLGGLAALQLTLAVAIERWRPEWRDPEYGCKLRLLRERVLADPGRPLVLALGSSRVLNGLHADLLGAPSSDGRTAPLVFNYGLTAHGPLHQLLGLRRLLSDGVRPDAVVVELLPALMPHDEYLAGEVAVGRQKFRDLAVLRRYGRPASGLYGRWLAERAVPCYSARYCLLSRYAPDWVPWARREDHFWRHVGPDGWLAVPPARSEDEHRADLEREHQRHAESFAHFRIGRRSDQAVRETLALCRSERIPVTVLLMPESSEFRSWYAHGAEGQLSRYLDELRRDGTPVVDARGWVSDNGFRDGHHLLPVGADAFTERFGREVLPLLNPAPAAQARAGR